MINLDPNYKELNYLLEHKALWFLNSARWSFMYTSQFYYRSVLDTDHHTKKHTKTACLIKVSVQYTNRKTMQFQKKIFH